MKIKMTSPYYSLDSCKEDMTNRDFKYMKLWPKGLLLLAYNDDDQHGYFFANIEFDTPISDFITKPINREFLSELIIAYKKTLKE